MKSFIVNPKFRPLIYSSILTLGLYILSHILENGLTRDYWIGSGILFIVVLTELFFTANHYHVHHRKNSKKKYEFESHKLIQYSHHLFLPSIFYLAIILFNYYNNQVSLLFLNLIITFLSFFILFENIHSYYKHQFSLHKSTNFIYDIIGALLVFMLVFDAIKVIRDENIESGLILALIFLLIYGFNIGLLTVRNTISRIEVLIGANVVSALTLFSMLLVYKDISAISIALFIVIIFRSYNLFVNFSVEHIITKDQLFEELLILILVASLLNLYIS